MRREPSARVCVKRRIVMDWRVRIDMSVRDTASIESRIRQLAMRQSAMRPAATGRIEERPAGVPGRSVGTEAST